MKNKTDRIDFGGHVPGRVVVPDGKIVVAYGGGVNTIALLVLLRRLGALPTAILMVDPGSERKSTERYRDEVMAPWLAAAGFPQVTVVTRAEEGRHRARAWRLESLREECMRIGALPSVAYGWKKCSQKYKGDTSRWWIARQPWAQAEWGAGRKIVKVIGYDVDEGSRVRGAFGNAWEDARLIPFYPLVAAKLGRDECEDLIRSEGLPMASKSACTFCPNNTAVEWEEIRRDEPTAFSEAVEMSRRAAPGLDAPDVVGLMRCNPHGRRQLHVWADGGYDGSPVGSFDAETSRDAQPCECAL